jgi:hypothetical protein
LSGSPWPSVIHSTERGQPISFTTSSAVDQAVGLEAACSLAPRRDDRHESLPSEHASIYGFWSVVGEGVGTLVVVAVAGLGTGGGV